MMKKSEKDICQNNCLCVQFFLLFAYTVFLPLFTSRGGSNNYLSPELKNKQAHTQ